MQAMAAASPQIHLTTFGYTYEGRPLPLAVVGAPGATPEQVLATKKIRIYLQGNIHAGEVEGKEALLWLLRSIAKGERADWFKSVVLLIGPIYNADGNERVSVANRGTQNGPVGGMGQRTNAQDLDLNRDCTKLETPEARSMAMLMTRYDPHVAIDLHTTDGSADSGYYLHYETSLNPNDSRATVGLLRDNLLPAVTKTIKAEHGWDYFYYGGMMRGGNERAYRSDAELAKPRYTSTYFGVRNKLGILVETYSYATFEDRIKANYWFLEEVIDYVVKNGEAVRSAVATAEGESVVGKALAVRQQLVKGDALVPVVFAETVSERNPYVADRPMRRRVPGGERTEMMPHYGTAAPTETSVAPRAYVLPAVDHTCECTSCRPDGDGTGHAARRAWRLSLGSHHLGRRRQARGARDPVLPDRDGPDGQRRAVQDRAVDAGRARVPGHAQDADTDRQMGSHRADRGGWIDRGPDGSAAGAAGVPAVRPAIGRRVHGVEHPGPRPRRHARAGVLPRHPHDGRCGKCNRRPFRRPAPAPCPCPLRPVRLARRLRDDDVLEEGDGLLQSFGPGHQAVLVLDAEHVVVADQAQRAHHGLPHGRAVAVARRFGRSTTAPARACTTWRRARR